MVSQKPKYCKSFERNSHWRKLPMIMVWESYCYASTKPNFFFIFLGSIFIHISANMSLFGLKFLQMILHTETIKLMYNNPFSLEFCTSQHSYPVPLISIWHTLWGNSPLTWRHSNLKLNQCSSDIRSHLHKKFHGSWNTFPLILKI